MGTGIAQSSTVDAAVLDFRSPFAFSNDGANCESAVSKNDANLRFLLFLIHFIGPYEDKHIGT